MTVLANDFVRPWEATGADVLDAVRRVGESGWYILGAEVRAFEEARAAAARRRLCIGCASGLDALEPSLRALGLRAGGYHRWRREVGVSARTHRRSVLRGRQERRRERASS